MFSGVPSSTGRFTDASGRIMQPWRQFLLNLWVRTGGSSAAGTFGSGDVKTSASSTVPDGWLACDGSAVSRTDYADLFSSINTAWGAGDGVTTFNLPDFRERMLIGASGAIPFATYGGAAQVVLTVGQLPAHNHPLVDPGHDHGVSDPGHEHTAATGAATAGALAGGAAAGNTGSATTGISIDSATTGITVGDTGNGDAVPIRNPFAAIIYLIKT